MEQCDCYDYKVPIDGNIAAYKNMRTKKQLKDMEACFKDQVYRRKSKPRFFVSIKLKNSSFYINKRISFYMV